mgnify:CR=1
MKRKPEGIGSCPLTKNGERYVSPEKGDRDRLTQYGMSGSSNPDSKGDRDRSSESFSEAREDPGFVKQEWSKDHVRGPFTPET